MRLIAKFHRPTFNRWTVIVLTNKQTDKLANKQTPLKTSTSLRYATPVGNERIPLDGQGTDRGPTGEMPSVPFARTLSGLKPGPVGLAGWE